MRDDESKAFVIYTAIDDPNGVRSYRKLFQRAVLPDEAADKTLILLNEGFLNDLPRSSTVSAMDLYYRDALLGYKIARVSRLTWVKENEKGIRG